MSTTKPRRTNRTRQPRKPTAYATAFVQDASITPRVHLARSSLRAAKVVWRSWVKFCSDPDIQLSSKPQDLPRVGVLDLRRFLHWHVNHSRITKLSTLYVFARQFRMAYKYIVNNLRLEFDLREERSDKPVLNVDDLLATLHYHWVLCDGWYVSERQRLQLSFMLLLIAYTGARPSAIVDCERHNGLTNLEEDEQRFAGMFTSHEVAEDCLKYKDVQIFKIRGHSSQDHVFLMVITLRLMKGVRNKSLAPKFVFHERDDNLALCPILHVLALAFADDAFSSPWLKEPQDLYSFRVDEDRGLTAVPLEWKAGILETPLLRRRTGNTEPWRYEDARAANSRLGKGVGFKDPFHFYQGRRGAGEAINASTSIAVRNRAMGHSRSDIFDKYYTNQTVAADTQSAFLGSPSQDWMVTLASHLGLTRDPNAHHLVPKPTSREVDQTQEISELLRRKLALGDNIVQTYGSFKKACGTASHREHKDVDAQLRSARTRTSKEIYISRWQQHFATIGSTEIARQREGEHFLTPGHSQSTRYEFEERAELSILLSRNDDVSTLAATETVERRIRALTAMSRLCHRRQGPRQRQSSPEPVEGEDSKHFDTESLQGNQCPWCLHDNALSREQRRYAYSQLSKLRYHIEREHLGQRNGPGFADNSIDLSNEYFCPFGCEVALFHNSHLKNHLASCHGFICGPGTRDRERTL